MIKKQFIFIYIFTITNYVCVCVYVCMSQFYSGNILLFPQCYIMNCVPSCPVHMLEVLTLSTPKNVTVFMLHKEKAM